MTYNGLHSFVLILTFLILHNIANGQDQRGNIVQYFGKEKVETISEGAVIHTFHEGLILRQNRRFLNSNSTPKEPVVGNHLLNPDYIMAEGEIGYRDQFGNEFEWEVIKVNDKNEFSGNGMRSAFLYLEYDSESSKTVLFEASGHTRLIANGMPHEGDHYDFGYSLIPIKLKKGTNTFLMTPGRFPRMRARLIDPKTDVQLTTRDMTLPDILKEEEETLVGGIRIINSGHKWFKGGSISVTVNGIKLETLTPNVSPLNSRKIAIYIPNSNSDEEKVDVQVELKDRNKKLLSEETISLNVKTNKKHHKRTFISNMDGSVQYYSVAPSSNDTLSKPALFFSVHGASVEATNQARAYKQKDWGHLVAPTNRRPFGFAWEDWGRLDALEVLEDAQNRFKTDPQHTYLTGHSMGGHGTWYLGATYPDKWGAIAPAAGYPDLLEYRGSFSRRLVNMSDEQLKSFGMTREQAIQIMQGEPLENADKALDSIIRRAGNPSRTLKLKRNYLHYGVYILHGEDDTVVPTFIARDMRALLGTYHPDFTYYEYPDGTHWYGNHSVDWPPIFDYFKFRSIKPSSEINRLEFYTGSPGVSASSHFVTINQQKNLFGISSFKFNRGDNVTITTENATAITVDLKKMGIHKDNIISVDGQKFAAGDKQELILKRNSEIWAEVSSIPLSEKGPHRNGGFKDAFKNNFVLVYATKGSKAENEWYYNRARVDAEMFYYRANGNVEVVSDREFDLSKFSNRNVILYGNASNNRAWSKLLADCPLQVKNGQMSLGERTLVGDNYGAYYIYRRNDSDKASVGVVTATGTKGMKAAYANHYLVNGTTYPDVLIFSDKLLIDGISGVECSGFFGNDWSYETGDFEWRD
jgi:pimeloyl-ACP methyl ester carboxylesterase